LVFTGIHIYTDVAGVVASGLNYAGSAQALGLLLDAPDLLAVRPLQQSVKPAAQREGPVVWLILDKFAHISSFVKFWVSLRRVWGNTYLNFT
jgi:hypothetical protein